MPAANYTAILALPTCRLGLRETPAGEACAVVFLPPDAPLLPPGSPLASDFADQLDRWLDDPHSPLALPRASLGTAFQQRVWASISAIPAGQTRRYGELAQQLGSAARAVGQACGANPFPLMVPCHRVLARSGLGGFAHSQDAWLLATKRWLLAREGISA